MNETNRIIKAIKHPEWAFGVVLRRCFASIMNDETFIKLEFFSGMGRFPNLKNPVTYNEKLQWLKLYDRKPEYTLMVDKYRVKEWVANKVGGQYVIPTLAAWDSVEDIRIDSLPNQFVLKCNHDSGSVIVCRDKNSFDLDAAKNKLAAAMKQNFYWEFREWPYKNVKRKIFAEEYIGEDLQDYRIYCFNGEPKLIYSYCNESEQDGSKPEPSSCDIMDINWNPLPFRQKTPPRGNIAKPKQLDAFLEIARKLSQGIPFVRIDFYECDKVFVGEMTFFPGCGFSEFHPQEWDVKLGEWLCLD